jgi:hypothetical protein
MQLDQLKRREFITLLGGSVAANQFLAFLKMCRTQYKITAQVIRELIRSYVVRRASDADHLRVCGNSERQGAAA